MYWYLVTGIVRSSSSVFILFFSVAYQSLLVSLGNGTETPALLILAAYLTSQVSIMERNAVIYLN